MYLPSFSSGRTVNPMPSLTFSSSGLSGNFVQYPSAFFSTSCIIDISSSNLPRRSPKSNSFSTSSGGSTFFLTLTLAHCSSLSSWPNLTLMMRSDNSSTVASCHSAPYLTETVSPTSKMTGSSAFFRAASASASSAPSGFAPSEAKATMTPRSAKYSLTFLPSLPWIAPRSTVVGMSMTEKSSVSTLASGSGYISTVPPMRSEAMARTHCSALLRAASGAPSLS
mmetsp:Transcript_44894/g.143822  ORF Transcript_44894/g.143822 Transcript_44894/m.143822 type:complete len:224 (-) Transcript_44894:247-918(-)